jgi:hypothetical protein
MLQPASTSHHDSSPKNPSHLKWNEMEEVHSTTPPRRLLSRKSRLPFKALHCTTFRSHCGLFPVVNLSMTTQSTSTPILSTSLFFGGVIHLNYNILLCFLETVRAEKHRASLLSPFLRWCHPPQLLPLVFSLSGRLLPDSSVPALPFNPHLGSSPSGRRGSSLGSPVVPHCFYSGVPHLFSLQSL